MSFLPPLGRLVARIRLPLICFSAVSVSLPMAWISLAKLMLFLFGLTFLVMQLVSQRDDKALFQLRSLWIILFALLAFSLSLTWSSAAEDVAPMSLVKHGKLLEIGLLVCLIRSETEARAAIAAFLVAQAVFLASSWAMAVGIPIPWASSAWATIPQFRYVVYSTYLDQSIIFATSSAIFWHLRGTWSKFKGLAVCTSVLALANVLLLLEGRTGYVVALAMIALAVMWTMPSRFRLAAAVLVPAIVMAAAIGGSSKMSQRWSDMMAESQNYSAQGTSNSSSGFRLNAWRRSLQAIAQEPIAGHGVGGWTAAVKHLEGASANQVFGENVASNPHQEYLLWGVELGAGGLLLLLILFSSLVRDALQFTQPVMRATVSVVAAAAIACLFNSSLYDALVGDFFCVALGLLMAMGLRSKFTDVTTIQNMHLKAIQ
jgi:O-antigen ligase